MGEVLLFASQRRHARRQVSFRCEIVTADDDFQLVARSGLDLSEGGMLATTVCPVSVGRSLVVAFRIPGACSWVDAEATVTRLVRGRRMSDNGSCVGIRFDRMDNVDTALLSAKLRYYPPPTPARHLRRDYATSIRQIFELAA